MRRLYLFLSILLLTGCRATEMVVDAPAQIARAREGRALTPEDAVSNMRSCLGPTDHFQIRNRRPWHSGFIVLYTAVCPPNEKFDVPISVVGYAYVEPHQGDWRIRSSLARGTESPPPEQLVDIARTGGWAANPLREFSIVFGQVLAPEVAAVEVTFADGMVLRDEPTNGVFTLVTDGKVDSCEMRIYGANGQLLKRRDLSPPQQPCQN